MLLKKTRFIKIRKYIKRPLSRLISKDEDKKFLAKLFFKRIRLKYIKKVASNVNKSLLRFKLTRINRSYFKFNLLRLKFRLTVKRAAYKKYTRWANHKLLYLNFYKRLKQIQAASNYCMTYILTWYDNIIKNKTQTLDISLTNIKKLLYNISFIKNKKINKIKKFLSRLNNTRPRYLKIKYKWERKQKSHKEWQDFKKKYNIKGKFKKFYYVKAVEAKEKIKSKKAIFDNKIHLNYVKSWFMTLSKKFKLFAYFRKTLLLYPFLGFLKLFLTKIVNHIYNASLNVQIYFLYLKNFTIRAFAVCHFVSGKLKKQYKINAIYQALRSILNKLIRSNIIKGFKFSIFGRFTRNDRAAFFVQNLRLPSNSKLRNIDFFHKLLRLRFGICSIRIWLWK